MARRLSRRYFASDDVTGMARDLLGKILVTRIDGLVTAGRIVETEAYKGPVDRASHAWNYRRTNRTEVMYAAGGVAYIYLCYGMHHLMNVVTGPANEPHAILLRALEPLEGMACMAARRGLAPDHPRLTVGPGALGQAMGLKVSFNGTSLVQRDSIIWIEETNETPKPEKICAGPRIGVDYAGEAAAWPWRFFIKESQWVSARRTCR